MNFLQAVGRAQPATMIRRALSDRARDIREQESFELSQQLKGEQLEQVQRQNQLQKEQVQEMNRLVPWETVSLKFEGGPESPMSQFIYSMAEGQGWIDKSQGGMGSIKAKHLAQLGQSMQDPDTASKLSGMRLDYWRGKLNEAKSVLNEKPNDKKAAAALQTASEGLIRATYRDQQIKEYMKTSMEYGAKTGKSMLDVAKFEETKRHNLAVEQKKRKGMTVTLPDGTIVEVGGQSDLTQPTTTQVQKDIIGLSDQLLALEDIGNNIFKDVLTFKGKAKKGALRLADFMQMPISEENKEFLGKSRNFIASLEQFFNTYRKEITGAQAAVKELKMLRQSVLNKNLTPTEFEYEFNRAKDKIMRGIRLKRMLLNEGLSENVLIKRFDKMYSSGLDVDDSEIDRRGDELKSQGFNNKQVIQRLKREGYLD